VCSQLPKTTINKIIYGCAKLLCSVCAYLSWVIRLDPYSSIKNSCRPLPYLQWIFRQYTHHVTGTYNTHSHTNRHIQCTTCMHMCTHTHTITLTHDETLAVIQHETWGEWDEQQTTSCSLQSYTSAIMIQNKHRIYWYFRLFPSQQFPYFQKVDYWILFHKCYMHTHAYWRTHCTL